MTLPLSRTPSAALISIVLPVYNELQVLDELVRQITSVLSGENWIYEIIFVNDGSSDGSDRKLDQLARLHSSVRVLHLSRNFGHQPAVQAGLDAARGDAVILMDADLQDTPQSLIKFLQAWQSGYEVVYAVRTKRKEAAWKRFLFDSFYRVLNHVSSVPIPLDAGNFSLIDRRVLNTINQLPERDRYFPGLRSWCGFRQIGIEVERAERYDNQPRVTLRGLFRLAKTAVFSFSNVPLTMFYTIGALSFLVCASVGSFALYHKVISGLAIPGWASTTTVVSLFGAINSLGIAILGEYAARIYDQVRSRPNYVLDPRSPQTSEQSSPEESFAGESVRRNEAMLTWLARNWGQEAGAENPAESVSSPH